MEMVSMQRIVFGAENGCEFLAGAVMDRAKKRTFAPVAIPASFDSDHAAIG
jgi:hypothetical protein